MNSFFRELKQRKVYRVALGYAIVAWLVVQISATVMPAYHAPEWISPTFITVIALGFPVALVLASAFEVKGGAIEKTPESSGSVSAANKRRVWILAAVRLIISALAVGGYWLWDSQAVIMITHSIVYKSRNQEIAPGKFQLRKTKDRQNEKANYQYD
jgi:Na+/melibiose symporter-like transporter